MGRIRVERKDTKNSKADIIWQLAVYIRLSREDGNDESESVVNQKQILNQFLENSFDGLYQIVDYYVDDGLTGTDDTRQDFMRMIQDIEQGKVTCMLCKTLSRAFRNYADQGYYLEQYFPLKGTRFISMGDPFVDTFNNPDAITGLEVPITGLMNDRYASRTSNDIRRTFHMKRQKGQFIGAFPPYGLLKDPEDKNRLILDDEIVPIKRDALGWILYDGMSLAGAAKKLNELGIPNPTAYKRSKGWKYNNPKSEKNDGMWCGTTVKRMLLDKTNLGHMVQGRQRVVSYKIHNKVAVPKDEWYCVENTHPATFTQKEYDLLLAFLRRDTRTANGERKVHSLSGFMRCADCKKALQRSTSKGNAYYYCRTYKEKSTSKCTKHSIREDQVTNAALAAIQAQIVLLDSVVGIMDEINASTTVDTQSQRIEKMLRDKQKELNRAKSISDGLYADWKTGEIDREEYQRMKMKYQEQIGNIKKAIENLEEELTQLGEGIDYESDVFKAFLKYRNVQKLDRAILIELVDTIFIHGNKEITIHFKFGDEIARIMQFAETIVSDK